MTDYNTIDKHAFATSNNSTDVGDLEETDYASIGTYDLSGGYAAQCCFLQLCDPPHDRGP